MADQPSIITDDKGIRIHVREDLIIKMVPGIGMPSFAGRTLTFEIQDTDISVPLIDHPTNPDGKCISVTALQLDPAANFSRFAVVDTTGGVNDTIWFGRLERYS